MAIKLINSGPETFTLALRVQPGAPRDRIVGAHGEALKLAVAKPPEDGAANIAVEKLLADKLGVRRSDVVIFGGFTSRSKLVHITGLSREQLDAKLADLLKL